MAIVLIKGSEVINIDNDVDKARLVSEGWRSLNEKEIQDAGMVGYESLVSPANTTVSTDGTISFTPPEPLSSESLFASLRAERDRRLSATDYLLMQDYPLQEDQRIAVQAYRQALRDLPAQSGAPWDGGGEATPWPEIPSVLQEQQGSSTSSVYTPGVV